MNLIWMLLGCVQETIGKAECFEQAIVNFSLEFIQIILTHCENLYISLIRIDILTNEEYKN